MKKGIHPKEYREVVFQDTQNGSKFFMKSTAPSSEKIKWEDGKQYDLVKVEISSASHPYFTGRKDVFVDTEGRIEKFRKRYAKASEKKEEKKK